MKKYTRVALSLLSAGMMAVAPGMDLSVQHKVLPDASGIADFCYQAIARTAESFSQDSLALAVLFCAFAWLCMRNLFRKPDHTHFGEYLLAGFLAVMMLLSRAIQTLGTISLLYANGFQVLKTVLYACGLYFIFLMALRELNRLLGNKAAVRLWREPVWAERRPFAAACAGIGIFWLPQVIVKYPGVLMWDTFWQIKQYLGETARLSKHPPFGTLLYGWMAKLGLALGNINLGYLLAMLLQVFMLLAVLAYSLTVMRRLNVRPLFRYAAFALYAVSPCYAGWATVICKDTTYLTLCLYITLWLIQFAAEGAPFFERRGKFAWLCGSLVLLSLTRYNGALIAGAVFLCMGIALLRRKAAGKLWVRVGVGVLATAVLGVGINAGISAALQVQSVYMNDVFSLPFQQTARVATFHKAEVPDAEAAIIDKVLDYDFIATHYGPWYADAVKDTYRTTATEADRQAYLNVWFKQLLRYPVDNLDAALAMNAVLFDLQFNRPMYVSLSDNSLTDYVYPYSYNDMKLYNSKEIEGLSAAQRMLTQWYFSFDDLPLIGWFATMGFSSDVLLMMTYLAFINRRKRALWAFIPSMITLAGCLFMPVVYLRYALPYVCALPLWFAAYDAVRDDEHKPETEIDNEDGIETILNGEADI